MFSVRAYLYGAMLAAALVTGSAAGAVSANLHMEKFSKSKVAEAKQKIADFRAANKFMNLRHEGFEGHKAWDGTSGTSNPQNTAVGSFTASGTKGSGKSIVNGGNALEVRGDNSMHWDRYDSDGPATGNWLDSNDNRRMEWSIKNVGKFNTIAFYVTDIADQGGKFSIKVGNKVFRDLAGADRRLKSGTGHWVVITLDEVVDDITIKLRHHIANDGFGIDNAMIANVSPVPVPPAAALLFTGIAALAGLRRRRKVAG